MRPLSHLVTVGALGVLTWPVSAAAQILDPAEVLFNEGVEQMEAKRYDQACPAIEQSYRLDPRPGTLFTLAECEAERGRVATAVARYDEYLALFVTLPPDKQVKQRERERISRAQKAALDPQVPELTLKLPPDAPPGTVVRRDGAELAQAALGVSFPVDPGEHLVTTQGPGGPVTELRVVVDKGERRELMLQVRGTPAAPPAPAKPAPLRPSPAPEPSPGGWRMGAFVTGWLGLAGLTVGAVTGALALDEKSVILANCNGLACNVAGKATADRVKGLGLASTLGIVGGTAGVSIATVLFLIEPARPSTSAAPSALAPPQNHASVSAGVVLAGPQAMRIELQGQWW